MGRDRSRLVAAGRDGSHLLDIGNVLGDGGGRYQIFLAELRLDAAAVQMPLGAIALDAACSARVAGAVITLGRLFDRQGIVAVGVGRGWSRRVGGHGIRIAFAGLSPVQIST
jgi:hypothetical protein